MKRTSAREVDRPFHIITGSEALSTGVRLPSANCRLPSHSTARNLTGRISFESQSTGANGRHLMSKPRQAL